MLLREDDNGVLAIGQAAHAWISGQLARAWGNERFGAVEPYAEVTLAAEQHDVGMAAWDLVPSWNPQTGLPHSFMEMALDVHLELWGAGPRRLLTQSRYAALLVSMHGRRLYERRDLESLPRAQADAIRTYLDAQRRFQEDLLASLRDDPTVDERTVQRSSQLIWTWDYLSLALCLDWAPCTAHDVPAVDGPVELELAPRPAPRRLSLQPWPFAAADVIVRCEGRRLTGRYESEEALCRALATAPWETVEFELTEE